MLIDDMHQNNLSLKKRQVSFNATQPSSRFYKHI